MKVAFYQRSLSNNRFSIELLFSELKKEIAKSVDIKTIIDPHPHKNVLKFIKSILIFIKNQSDVNHITGDIHYYAMFLKKKKTILTIHDIGSFYRLNGIKKFLFWFLWIYLPIKNVRYVTVISNQIKQELINVVNVNTEKIHVVYNCYFSDISRSNNHFNHKKPSLLQIGTKQNKNLDRLISAISHINCKLWIVGSISKTQKDMLIKENIDFKNFVNIPRHELITLYQNCDIVTFVSTYEGFGLPILEANAAGKPVITSNLSAMPEIANNSALLVNPFSVNEIEEGIRKLIENSDLRVKLINNGLINLGRFNPKNIAKQYINIYKKI